jgi:hypothetical protein
MATMIPSSTTIESKSLFIQIIPSGISVKLIQSSTSLITHGQGQDLKLDPGGDIQLIMMVIHLMLP